MDTTFQTQTQNAMPTHEGGFLKALRVIPLSVAIVAFIFIEMIQVPLAERYSQTLHFVLMALYNITFAFSSVVITAHVVKGEKAKTLGLIAFIATAVTLIISLTQNILWFAGTEYNSGIEITLQVLRMLSSLTTFVALVVGCEKKYRIGIALLIASTLFGSIKGFLYTYLFGHLATSITSTIIDYALFGAGLACLFYHGIVSPGKHEPKKLAIESEKFDGNILMKVLNCCAAGFLFIYIIFATFYKPAMNEYGYSYEECMPAAGYLFEIVLLLLLTNLVILGIKLKTLATKIMGFSFAGLLLTINLIIIVTVLIQEPKHFSTLLGLTNLCLFFNYAFLMIILFWIAKAQTTGIARKAFAVSTAALIAGLSMTNAASQIISINYSAKWGYGDTYMSAVIVVLVTFAMLPYLIFQLLTISWPKVRTLFFALPIIALMLIFTIVRLNMNGSWEKEIDYSNYGYGSSTEMPYSEEGASTEDDNYGGSYDESYDTDEYVEVDSTPDYGYDENY